MEFKGERLARVAFFVKEEGGTGGEAAERGGEARANGSGVIEGENPVVLGDGEQFRSGVGKGKERSSGGIDEGAEHAGGGGLAAGGRTVENKNRMRTGGAECGEEPDGEASAVGVGREVEGGWKETGGWLATVMRHRAWEFGIAAAVEKSGGGVGSDLPTAGSDFDDFAIGVAEIKQDGVGLAGIAERGDAPVNGKARSARKGSSFEGANGLAKSVVGRRLAIVRDKTRRSASRENAAIVRNRPVG